jgi:hypothetical protein
LGHTGGLGEWAGEDRGCGEWGDLRSGDRGERGGLVVTLDLCIRGDWGGVVLKPT